LNTRCAFQIIAFQNSAFQIREAAKKRFLYAAYKV
jgi:hypothetical protein